MTPDWLSHLEHAPKTIVCYYIEVDDELFLKNALHSLGFPIYDATHLDPMTRNSNFHTLDEIEAALELK